MLRVLLDPARTPGLKARDGRTFALRNDGTPTQGLSAAYLFFDALKGIDKAFESWAMAHPGDTDRQANLKAARSQVVDTYLSVKGTGPSAAFENPAIVRALPKVLDTLRAQLSSHCPRDPKHPEAPCVWAAETLPKEVEEWMSGPSYAAAVDLLDVVRKDETARRELERLALYLIDDTAVGGQPSRLTTSLAAAADSLLFLNGASNLTPIYRMMSTAALPIERDAGGRILQRGFVASSVDLLARLYARCVDETGKTRPDMEVDPHRAFGEVLKRMVMPIESRADGQSPAELLVSILSDVNRADPSKTDAFQGADFGNIAKELNEFLLDPAQGLEQVYEVIREATKNL
jgi:hypothetical protein